uniref:Uncharacterized protein n=1 Tax=Sphaerodactylus townsendi TaxID=933632 RepID=A0ACB8FH76_9SAUR
MYVESNSEIMNINVVNGKKNPRHSAAVAASKIKLISNTRESISSPEVGDAKKTAQRLPYRSMSAAARKLILDVLPSPSESETELTECESNLSQSTSADNHNISSNSLADSESEKKYGGKNVKSITEAVTEEQKQRSSLLKIRKPGTLRRSKSEPDDCSNLPSDSESQTEFKDIDNSQSRTIKKRKRSATATDRSVSNGISELSRAYQRRKRPKVNEENDSEDLDYTKYKRVNRRSKIRTRNGGRRTVRYADDEDDCEM